MSCLGNQLLPAQPDNTSTLTVNCHRRGRESLRKISGVVGWWLVVEWRRRAAGSDAMSSLEKSGNMSGCGGFPAHQLEMLT